MKAAWIFLTMISFGLYIHALVLLNQQTIEIEALQADNEFLMESGQKLTQYTKQIYGYNLELIRENNVLKNRLRCDIEL